MIARYRLSYPERGSAQPQHFSWLEAIGIMVGPVTVESIVEACVRRFLLLDQHASGAITLELIVV